MRAVIVTMILDVEEAEVADAVNEILREQQRSWVESSCLLDYSFAHTSIAIRTIDPILYREGDAFADWSNL